VAQVTEPASRPGIGSRHVRRRLSMRVYLEVVATIIGLLGAYVALTQLLA
jgi:hypothetical protein